MRKILVLLVLLSQTLFGQKNSEITEKLIGYWEGAFIKNNSYQKIEIEISEREGKIYGLQIMDEWHPTFGEFEVPVKIDSTGLISFGTGYGKAKLKLDKQNLEIIGQLEGMNPSVYLHLKKTADKPKPNYRIEQVSITSQDVELYAHLHIPLLNPTRTAVIFVGGRGCEADQTQYNLYAKFLRKYGIAVLTYQKRGTGNSTGECITATIEDLANDLNNVKAFLKAHKSNFDTIGVLGVSAGGWTMVKAQQSDDYDFMISIVGPSTSVREQQIQSATYGSEFYKLAPTAKQNLLNYTNLLFDVKQTKKGYRKLTSLLQLAKKEGWNQLLESTDIVQSENDINKLWVKRHNFNPENVLKNYKNPFLGIYGQRDWIVPPKENIEKLNECFKNNLENLTTVVAYNAEHGMEMEDKWIDLGRNISYWHFYRISPQVRIAIVDFLNKHGIIK
ncbi:alpha/beta hydrolase [Spongiivirga sp. MCCC 1A20706]|uniref:alpha/beta hydrolase n=1 Tax=Spongiivirga sp. MCCC 1A20706 TaxID=3160963 RepID=UPI0039779C69